MSFAGTPLGQGRRLDHSTFLGKPSSTGHRPPSPRRLIPTSYAYGAPTLGSRSPPKPSSPTREQDISYAEEDDQNDPALTRYARLKQREQVALNSRPGGPKIITSPPKPDKWSVKDTSVNIATAFTQAATDMQPATNPNNSWASGQSRSNPSVPRSTSVEYEKEAQATATRRLAVPPSRFAPPRSAVGRKPLSKSASVRHVPDSEGEGERLDQNGRGKSPFEQVVDAAKRALAPASFYLRQRSHEPEDQSLEAPQPSANDKDISYDYAAEEREYQAAQQSKRMNHPTHKRGRMSTDNKAYKPPTSGAESSDDASEDGDKTRKRKKKKKKEPVGGPLTSLPVLGQDKKKKRKSRGSKGNVPAEDDEESESDEQAIDRQSAQIRASVTRNSVPPPLRQSVPRGSVPPETSHDYDPDTSMDIEQGLHSIPEVDEQQAHSHGQRRSVSRPPSSPPAFSIGGLLGTCVNYIARAARSSGLFIIQTFVTLLFIVGRIFGTMYDVLINRPRQWASKSSSGIVLAFATYLVLGLVITATWYALQDPLLKYVPRFSSDHARYAAPEVPAANIAELAARLQKLENALSGISLDTERTMTKADNGARAHSELVGRLGALESRVVTESKRVAEAEVHLRNLAKEGVKDLKQDVEVLQAQVQLQHQQQQNQGRSESSAGDEARAKLRALEERVGSVEGGVKEALELGKKAGSSGLAPPWWTKIALGTSKAGLMIKSADGQDVTALIGHLVDTAASTYNKDTLARPDYALHSGGARVIPSLTSPTFEIRPASLRSQLVGLVTGNGYAIGRPPITALHHELHNGHCWPFPGAQGQLAIALAAPTYISDVTIDHVAREVAFDMRSAPRQMEVWGMVEGKDNVAKVREWMAERARRRRQEEEARESGEEQAAEDEQYPKTLPRSPQYVRIANFSYDIHASSNVQTFAVSDEVRALGVDFGVVVLRVLSNWGREEFTCLYRMRVHGQRMGETPLPYPEELA